MTGKIDKPAVYLGLDESECLVETTDLIFT